MTARPQPNNATPQRLHLTPQTIPRMPFSSPMGEEVLSPTSPNASRSPPQHQIKLSQNRSGQENDMGDEWTLPSQRPQNGERNQSQEKGQSKPKWPGLNVVTNFSKPPALAQRAADGATRANPGLGLTKQGKSVVTSRKASVETLGLGHQPSGKSLTSLGSKGRLGDLKRASSKWSNLSPSDRAVVIGISVSPEELAEHTASPEASPAQPEGGLSEQHALDRRLSITPTIVVTPAKEKAPWSASEEEPTQIQQRRATPSIYSPAPPPNGARVIDTTVVPPIPPLPPDAKRHNAQNQPGEKTCKDPPPRIISTFTEIDKEESPNLDTEGRPGTGESQLRILTKQSSLDTIATRRSQGWWNHIVSPFFPRSPMTFKAYTPPKEPASSILRPQEDVRDMREGRTSFPPTPKSDGLRSGHTSFTDSTMDAAFEKKRLELDGFHDRSTLIMDEPQELPARESALIPTNFEGFGAAAEYYEACLYDTYSTTPYFECQNHTCVASRVGPSELHGPGNDGFRGIGEDTVNDKSRAMDGGAGLAAIPEAPRMVEQTQSFAVQQAPTNRFSAAFHEAIGSKPTQRPMSETTIIEDLDTTPDIQVAHVAPIVRAPEPVPAAQPPIPEEEPEQSRAVEEPPQMREATPRQTPAPAYSPPRKEKPPKRFVAVMPPDHRPHAAYQQPMSPEPLSPGQQRQARQGAIHMDEVPRDYSNSQVAFDTPRSAYFHRDPESEQTTIADLYPPPRDMSKVQRAWEIKEKDELPPRQPRKHEPLIFPRCRNCFSSAKPKNKKKKRIMMAIAAGLVALVILVLALAMTLTRKGNNKTPVQSQWLNITGYPPIPTGVSTIIQPNAVDADPDCVHPATMWSCALPKEEQQGIAPNAPNQPNFRVEIVFQNGTNTTSNSTTGNASDLSKRSYGLVAHAVSASGFIRNRSLQIRNAFSNSQFTPSPAPPNLEDQTFLGNTTDGNTAPFDGDFTPFFMSFESATKLSSGLSKRQSSNPGNATDAFPDPTSAIPSPDTNPDGTAAAANLYPHPSAQPLRLYNRGQDTEHYGFYTYFDRSIFLKSTDPLTSSASSESSTIPDDGDGGADENAALVRCTWAQTRFLVQIWTKKGNSGSLLQSAANTTSNSTQASSVNSTTISNSSANDFTQPGSFPYPVTITLDRHGGDITKKMIYCYGLDDREHYNSTQKQFQLEDRGVGGQLVNPALGPFGDVNVTTAQGGPGGIDGGSGGCLCKWQNWNTGL